MLGVAYINGIGVPRNAKLAAHWIFKAAQAGHQQAQLMLATMLQEGLGTPKNEFAARRWYDKAAHGSDATIAAKARDIRDKIDQHVLFSGAFRPEDVAAVLAVGFGLSALMLVNGRPMSEKEKADYDEKELKRQQEQEQEQDREKTERCMLESAAACL